MSRVQLLSPPPLFNLETLAVSNDSTNREAVLVCGDSEKDLGKFPENRPNFPKVGNTVGHKNQRFFTCAHVAERLGVTKRTVNRWCGNGLYR